MKKFKISLSKMPEIRVPNTKVRKLQRNSLLKAFGSVEIRWFIPSRVAYF